MCEEIKFGRRDFVASAAVTLAATQLWTPRCANAQSKEAKAATATTFKPRSNASFDIVKQIDAGVLNVGYRREFAKLIWHLASPKWVFDDATFDRSASAFDNPDHVGIVIHNYRWRLGAAEGEAKYDVLENRLAESPVITIPTITLEGDANGAPHPDPSSYARKFVGNYEHRTITGGIGHNLPQEAPQAFAQAVIDVDGH